MGRRPSNGAIADAEWPVLVARAAVAGDVSIGGVARIGRVDPASAADAIERARSEGVIDADGLPVERRIRPLIDALDAAEVEGIHLETAQFLLELGREHFVEALFHLRDAGRVEQVVHLADSAARRCLRSGNLVTTGELLQLAGDLDGSTDPVLTAERLCLQAEVADGLGDDPAVRRHLLRAIDIAESRGDSAMVVRAVAQYVLPTYWYAGTPRMLELLQRADRLDLCGEDRLVLDSLRVMAEFRVPVADPGGQQLAWVTRPHRSRGKADALLAATVDAAPWTRGLALLAWRSTNNSPALLDRRRAVSGELFECSQAVGEAALIVEAAIFHFVDQLEAGERDRAAEAIAIGRFHARRSGAPRLRWRTDSVLAANAVLEGRWQDAARLRNDAQASGQTAQIPAWFGVDLMLDTQISLHSGQLDHLEGLATDDDSPLLEGASGCAAAASVAVRLGHHEVARRRVRRAIRLADPETGYLFTATRLADAVLELGDAQLIRSVIDMLAPWSTSVSTSGNGWWCDGPVAVWLAALHSKLGDAHLATQFLAVGEPLARRIGDVRSLRRAADLGARPDVPAVRATEARKLGITAHELEVIGLLADGDTNPQIALKLHYSVATIRRTITTIYRKLGVDGRAGAVAAAMSLGLVAPRPPSPRSGG